MYRDYLSFVIIRSPWTSKPLVICGPIPLNKDKGPSCSMIYDITSKKFLNGLPCLSAGGLDCSPTLATISGCVTMVAKAFDIAPSTVLQSVFHQA